MPHVEVTVAEIVAAYRIGDIRNARARSADYRPSYRQSVADTRAADRHGALAEFVVAKALGVEWRPVANDRYRRDRDVAGWNIRATPYTTGQLHIRPDDPAADLFLLVPGRPRQVDVDRYEILIAGWIQAGEARDLARRMLDLGEQWIYARGAGRPAQLWLPRSALHEWIPAAAWDIDVAAVIHETRPFV